MYQRQHRSQQSAQQAPVNTAGPQQSNSQAQSRLQTTTYRVQAGDTLAAIAARCLGDASRYTEIAALNQISNPNRIYPGQVLKIPVKTANPAPDVTSPAPDITSPAPEAANQTPVSTATPTTPVATRQHTVYPGDTLSSIAEDYLGDASRWTEIAAANKITSPRLLRVGQVLIIPNSTQTPSTSGANTKTPSTPSNNTQTPSNNSGTSTLEGDKLGSDMAPDDLITLSTVNGLDRTMAAIYNEKGKYLKQKAGSLGISAAAAAAVLEVESGNSGFASSGKMVIRFENHIFHSQWGDEHQDTFNQHFKYNNEQHWTGHQFRADPNGQWESFHGNQTKEWEVLEFARGLDDEQALNSISMGAAQVMGFNYATLGYSSAREMFDAMSGALKPQLDGMFDYIANSQTCLDGLKRSDYTKFASGYNGSGQAEHYGSLIAGAAGAYQRVTQGRNYA